MILSSLHESMPQVVRQLQLLWSEKMIRIMFAVLLEYTETSPVPDIDPRPNKKNSESFLNSFTNYSYFTYIFTCPLPFITSTKVI